ncbi:Beta-galactosidase 6 [Hordeum vulgare]|nr:Beta-galactosidase 6 [Hordeum vulgare]
MRQFGLHQDIPPSVPRCIDEETHKMSNMDRSGVDWNAENIQWINQWNNEALQNIVPQQRFRRRATVRGWDHLQIGLRGEDLHLYNPSEASPEWVSDNSYPTNNPLTWYKSKFTAPAGDDPLAIDFTGMGKGEAWVNGQSIGRYWPTNIAPQSGFVNSCNYRGSYSATKCLKKCGQPSQILYHVPRSFLEPGSNDIVLFEQFGGNPSKISFMTKQIESVCAHVSEDHPDQIDSWVSSHQKLQRSGPALRLECPKEGQVISNIKFASFRTPGGTCGSYSHGECSSSQALAVSLRRHASGPALRLLARPPPPFHEPPLSADCPFVPHRPAVCSPSAGESLVPAPLVAIGTVAEQTVPQHHRAAEATAGRRDSSPSTGNMNIQTRGWNKSIRRPVPRPVVRSPARRTHATSAHASAVGLEIRKKPIFIMPASAAATPPRDVSTAVSGADVAPPPHVSADAASPPRVVSTTDRTPPAVFTAASPPRDVSSAAAGLLIEKDNTGYAGDDSSSEDESLSLNANKSLGHNYMSQDESYSGNVHANDGNDDYDIDEQSYAESGTHQKTDEHGDVSYFAGCVDGPEGNDEHVGDLEFDLDIGYDEYQQETLDRHWEVMAKTFRSEGEAYMLYNQYAKDRGFSIRRDLKRFGKAMEEIIANKDILNNEEPSQQSFTTPGPSTAPLSSSELLARPSESTSSSSSPMGAGFPANAAAAWIATAISASSLAAAAAVA